MPKYIFGSGYLIIWLLVSRYWVLPLGFLWPSLVRAETSLRLRQLDQFPAHTSHRMHCISGGALHCNEHVLHCAALFFSQPESSSSLCSWLCCSRFQCNESPTLHSPPHAPSSYIAAGFWTLVSAGGADCTGAVHYYIGAGFELLYALVQCTIMLTPRVLHFAARLSVIYAFGRAALFVCPTCGDDDAFPTDRLKVLLKGL